MPRRTLGVSRLTFACGLFSAHSGMSWCSAPADPVRRIRIFSNKPVRPASVEFVGVSRAI
jgi:hypothetical protein